ncbi:unnamed protein product (macronuclear) [Paramecium tetraurelia]|uniref:C2 domain-containing protein n=1 Tax=Paramecium tetraurelia TaxID=5888 RepID=A0EF23_PARTE|nr:uncharacterized protein GSPATT00026237001 [Paramecium tetraurelia]CAK93914.1 unnamed protein product [Paramecium tetraurelia]|eukprot:XP_001461287.1 hypothetical protein (macronuclear) [Paramecium tetraurelia strain d4-2]
MQQTYNPDERMHIELFLAARQLPNLEFFSKSDPYLELYYSLAGQQEQFLGRTETAECNLDPNWEKTFEIEYWPDLIQMLKFQIFDQDRMGREFMGEAQVTIKEILQYKNSLIQLQIKRYDKPAGSLICKAVLFKESNHSVQWQFSGINLKNMDGIFGKTDPFLKFYLFSEGVWCQIHQTEYIKDDLNPKWKEFEVSLQRLCFNDENKKFKIECLDRHEKGKNNQIVGSFETSIDEIFNKNVDSFQLIQPKGGSAGTIKILNKKRIYRANFDDYIKQGTKFNVIIGIDYSSNNGVPSFPDSLHTYIEKNNIYLKAVNDVAKVLEIYDIKKLIALYGMGAEPHFSNYNCNSYQTLFPLTGDFQNPQVTGYQEAVNNYQSKLRDIVVKGDLQLEDFIKYVQTVAEHNAGKLIYTIAVIIGQEQITDLQVVQNLILSGQKLPYSLMYVGVGEDDFKDIKQINDLINQQNPPIRNNFTFYQYQKELPSSLLKKQLLNDLPKQVVSYHQ